MTDTMIEKKSRGDRRLLMGAIVFLAAAYLLVLTQKYFFRGDGSIPLLVAQRMLGGEVLYRDLRELWMPGTFYLLAGMFKLVGVSYLAARILVLLNFVFLLVTAFLLGREINGDEVRAALGMGLFLLLFSPLNYYYNHGYLGLLGLGLVTLFLVRRGRRLLGWGEVVGLSLLVGLTVIFNQWEGAVAVSAVGLWWLLKGEKSWRGLARMAGFFVGAGLPLVIISGYFLSQAILNDFFREVVVFPLFNYHRGNMEIFPSLLWFVLTAFYLLFTLHWRLGGGDSWRDFVEEDFFEVFLVGVLFHLTSLINVSRGHVFYNFLFAAPLMVYWLEAVIRDWQASDRMRSPDIGSLLRGRRFLVRSVLNNLSFFLVVILLMDFVFHVVPYIDYFLFRCNVPVETPRGVIYTDSFYARNLEVIRKYLRQNIEDDEVVFMGPYAPYLYFISTAKNPLPYSYLAKQHYTDPILTEAVQQLEEKEVDEAVFLTSETVFRDNRIDKLTCYILKNFEPVILLEPPSSIRRVRRPIDAIWEREGRSD